MPKRQSGESISDCVARAMSIMADEPKYKDLDQDQMLGRAYGICKEMQKDQAFTTSSSGAYNPRFSAPKCKKCGLKKIDINYVGYIVRGILSLKSNIQAFKREIEVGSEHNNTIREMINLFNMIREMERTFNKVLRNISKVE